MLEGRVVIGRCGCWIIREHHTDFILRCYTCPVHVKEGLDVVVQKLYLDKVDSVSATGEGEESQLWLT